MKVVHVITGLQTGGAEVFLAHLLPALAASGIDVSVIVLGRIGSPGEILRQQGVPVRALNAAIPWGAPRMLIALRRALRDAAPDLVQGWLYHGNLAATLAVKIGRLQVPVLWNIRNALYGLYGEKCTTRLVARFGAWASSAPRCIIYNSRVAAQQHLRYGYRSRATAVISNGFDSNVLHPDPVRGAALRRSLGIDDDAVLIGNISRYHRVKDHDNFLRAAAIVAARVPVAHFLLAGRGVSDTNGPLNTQIAQQGLNRRVTLIGERNDIPAVLNALDICVSASRGESFPNVVGEAMCSAVPCVVTDVGASAELLGETGSVVPACNPKALAQAILGWVQAGAVRRRECGKAARQRIIQYYDQRQAAWLYAQLYWSIITPAASI